jgi:DNA adenine methylase
MYLKWIGGKTGVSEQILPYFPADIDIYVEPFVGSGAMFFSWYKSLESRANGNIMSTVKFPSKIVLCDINSHLINCHKMIRDNCDDVLSIVMQLEKEHNSRKNYLPMFKKIRKTVTDEITDSNKIELAAKFIYINKTCFNGIWRVNRDGKNNVPTNKREHIRFNEDTIRDASRILKKAELREVNFVNLGFSTCEGVFVYMDPPYYPISKTSNFASYNKERENDDNLLAKLKTYCNMLDSCGIKWIMSNSNAANVLSTFANNRIEVISAHRFVRAINKDNEKREKIIETIIMSKA